MKVLVSSGGVFGLGFAQAGIDFRAVVNASNCLRDELPPDRARDRFTFTGGPKDEDTIDATHQEKFDQPIDGRFIEITAGNNRGDHRDDDAVVFQSVLRLDLSWIRS